MKKAFIQLHSAVFLAGFTGVLGRMISLNEGLIVWYRLLISIIALWIFFLFTKRPEATSIKNLLPVILVGLITALHWVTFYGSIKYANVSVALICFSAIAFFTSFTEPVILKKKFSTIELLLGLLVMVGIYIIFHFEPEFKTGIIIGLVSAFLASLFPAFNKKFLQKYSPITLTTFELTGGFIILSLLMPVYLSIFPTGHILPTLNDWLGLLVLSLFCTVLAFQLSMNALQKISAFTVNLTYNLEPVYGILLAFFIYKENKYLGPSFYVGLSIIFIAVGLQSIRIVILKHKTNL